MTKWEIGKLEGADPTLGNFEELCDAACKGLPERKHELPGWAAQGVMQYEYSKKLHKETSTEDGQTVKAAQTLQDLELQPFQQVEEALRLVPTLSPVTLGRREPAEAEDVFDLQEMHQANKLTTLKKRLEEADPKQKQHPTAQCFLAGCGVLRVTGGTHQEQVVGSAGRVPCSLDKASEKEVTTKLEEAKKHKLECEHDLKKLQKALAPTKTWLKNTGLEA